MYRVCIHHVPGPDALARLAATYPRLGLEGPPEGHPDSAGGSYVNASTLARARSIVAKLRTLRIGGEPVTCEIIRNRGFFDPSDLFADGSASPGRRPAVDEPRG